MSVHPCGQVVDFLRSAYRTKLRPWEDSDETIDIRWFRAPEGAKVIEEGSPYRSRNWRLQQHPWTGAGEVEGATRSWDAGDNTEGYTGQSRCGSSAAWEGARTTRDQSFSTDERGVSTCCQTVHLVAGGGAVGGGTGYPVMGVTVQLVNESVVVSPCSIIEFDENTHFSLTDQGEETALVQLTFQDASTSAKGLVNTVDQAFSGVKEFVGGIIVGNSTSLGGAIGFYSTAPDENSCIVCNAGPSNRDVLTLRAGVHQQGSGSDTHSLIIDNYLGQFVFDKFEAFGGSNVKIVVRTAAGGYAEGYTGTVNVTTPTGTKTLTFTSGLLTGVS